MKTPCRKIHIARLVTFQMLNLVEKFITLSGEAPITGEPIFLIRFSGCNLDCKYCDTPYNVEVNSRMSREELILAIREQCETFPGIKVLFTGGEPLLNDRREQIIHIVREMPDIMFYIETNGSIAIETEGLDNLVYVVDWKTPSSGYEHSFLEENIPKLRPGVDCVKLVTAWNDLEWVKKKVLYLHERQPGVKIYLSPHYGDIDLEELAGYIIANKLPAALSVQLHKIIWGEKRGV